MATILRCDRCGQEGTRAKNIKYVYMALVGGFDLCGLCQTAMANVIRDGMKGE